MSFTLLGSEPEKTIQDLLSRHPGVEETFIFPPGLPWSGSMFQRPQQLARALARQGALVFYLQPRGIWPEMVLEPEERLYLCQARAGAFRAVADPLIYGVTWNLPQLASYPSARVLYDVIDHLDVFEGNPRRLRRNHRRMLEEAHLVTTTSQALHREVREVREDAVLVPNAADWDHFGGREPDSPPADLATILEHGRPVIGYHGALARWFDYRLVRELAVLNPGCEFVLIGVDYDQTLRKEGIADLPNVHWLGRRPYRSLPAYVKGFDVGLIPFVVNEITRATSPIKMYEYMAAGVPVVSTPLPEAAGCDLVMTADTIVAWMEKIGQALSLAEDPGYTRSLRELGKAHRWGARAKVILQELEGRGDRRSGVDAGRAGRIRRKSVPGFLRLWARIKRTWSLSGLRGLLKAVYEGMMSGRKKLAGRKLFQIPRALQETCVPEDYSQVTLYREDPENFPSYRPAVDLRAVRREGDLPVSLVATAYNEAGSAAEWMEGILGQKTLPDEVVVVDAGSGDGTVAILRSFAEKSPFPVRILEAPGANIARGRNLAVEEARFPLIAVTDFGCRAEEGWLERLTAPFHHDPQTGVAAGWSRPVDRRGAFVHPPGWAGLEEVNPQTFLPSSRSIAFQKSAWRAAGGYPEWLTRTGEDTYFALSLKRSCPNWAFVPSAVVDWKGAGSFPAFLGKTYAWSAGNGELGYNRWQYIQAAKRAGAFLLVLMWILFAAVYTLSGGGAGSPWSTRALLASILVLPLVLILAYAREGTRPWRVPGELAVSAAQALGYLAGARRKRRAARRRLSSVEGWWLILAGVPVDDTGGGARSAQLAKELLARNQAVIYLHRFPKFESEDAGVRIAHPNLFHQRLEAFDWEQFQAQYGLLDLMGNLTALVEMPVPAFLPLLERIRSQGGTLLYDLIDDWDTSLGGSWYSGAVEEEIIHLSQGWVGSAPSLVARLEELSPGPVLSLPNAVNDQLFNPDLHYQRPEDLPEAERVILYIGALWGEWFDWELLTRTARTYPEAAVAAIGDYRGQCPDPPPNLCFLGLKPQRDLPAYLAHGDLALIPWKVTPITRATSPLKVYEYLAMRVPVVGPDLPPLSDLPGVWLAEDRQAFVNLAGRVGRTDFPGQEAAEFIRENNWRTRVEDLLSYVRRLTR